MQLYECTFIVRQDLSVQDVYKFVDRYKVLVQNMGGEFIKKEYWGLRNLSYEIKKNKKGHYVFFILNISLDVLNKIRNDLKVSEDVIKHLIIKVETVQNKPTLMMESPTQLKK